jgi:hypothetical protein
VSWYIIAQEVVGHYGLKDLSVSMNGAISQKTDLKTVVRKTIRKELMNLRIQPLERVVQLMGRNSPDYSPEVHQKHR